MTAFDTDVLSDLAKNVPVVVARAALVPVAEQCVPIVAAEEVLRGQLATVRKAQAGAGRPPLDQAYAYLEETLRVLVTRNARDYAEVPGLNLEVWN